MEIHTIGSLRFEFEFMINILKMKMKEKEEIINFRIKRRIVKSQVSIAFSQVQFRITQSHTNRNTE